MIEIDLNKIIPCSEETQQAGQNQMKSTTDNDHARQRCSCHQSDTNSKVKTAWRDIVHYYAGTSSAHGVPHLARTRTKTGLIFWSSVCVGATFMCIILSSQLLDRYRSFPRSVKVDLANIAVRFPSVTICNLRNLDLFTFADALLFENGSTRWNVQEDKSYKGRTNATFPHFERDFINIVNNYNSYFDYAREFAKISTDEGFAWKADSDLLSRSTFAANFDSNASREGGFHAREFIASCQYAGHKCSYRNFKHHIDPVYFNCFTFQPDEITGTWDTMHVRPEFGLSLVLFIPGANLLHLDGETLHKMSLRSEMVLGSEGARVQIHPPNSSPYSLSQGSDIPRGVAASVGISMGENYRLPKPHGNCTHDKFIQNTQLDYNILTCTRVCMQKLIVKNCGCTDSLLPLAQSYDGLFPCAKFDEIPEICLRETQIQSNFEYCRKFFEPWFERLSCLAKVHSNISKNLSALQQCKCFPACTENVYNTHYTLSDWPEWEKSKILLEHVLYEQEFISRFPPNKASKYFKYVTQNGSFSNYTKYAREKHFLRLNVFVSDTSVMRVTETEDYSLGQLVSDIGGQMGLWIGVSIISAVEALELVVDLVKSLLQLRFAFGKLKRSKTSLTPSQQDVIDDKECRNESV